MPTPFVVWTVAAGLYAAFLLWYLPLWRRVSPEEVRQVVAAAEAEGLSPERLAELRRFLEEDRGDSFVIVNLLQLREPKADARRAMEVYQRRFMGRLLGMGGFPLYAGRAAMARNIEQWGIDAEGWDAVALVRYRCRRDLARMILFSLEGDTREFKHAGLERTFALPVLPIVSTVSPCVLAGLIIALAAALLQIVAG
jgi:hypothetical protein